MNIKKIISAFLVSVMIFSFLSIDSFSFSDENRERTFNQIYDERQNFRQNDDLIFGLITLFGNQKEDLKQYKLNQIKTGDSFISIISYPLYAILTTFAAFGVISAYVIAALIRFLNVKFFNLISINQD